MAIVKQIQAGNDTDTITLGTPGFPGSQADNDAGGVGRRGGGTPADDSQPGDVLTNIDGQTIDNVQAVSAVLGEHHGGDKVSVTWTDSAGASHKATATLIGGRAN
jgi:S1-C subfamily serine protease